MNIRAAILSVLLNMLHLSQKVWVGQKMKFKELGAKIHSFYKRSDRFVHLLVGLPSYDKYVEHMKRHHPDEAPKSQKEFFKEALDKKYGANGAKC